MLDSVEIVVKGGNGGDGAISFHREKFVPLGGPDGGDGGNGGDVILTADPSFSDLSRFKTNRVYRAGDGAAGAGNRRHGKKGEDLVLRVPVGTVVYRLEAEEKSLAADLDRSKMSTVAARGGEGGMGNSHFASSTNQAPRIAQKGEEGEERRLLLEMRLIADVGIIGRPNAGKSSLLAAASAARPKVADYPFTTRKPVLGVVEIGERRFVLAEIPGLIEDAALGRGLGHDFLRHALRTRVLIHLIDGTSVSPLADMYEINSELGKYDPSLAEKPQLVVVNKIDLLEVRARMEDFREKFHQAGIDINFTSAATGEGVPELMAKVRSVLEEQEAAAPPPPEPLKVFRPQPRRERIRVRREGNVLVVDAPSLERIVARMDTGTPEAELELRQQLIRLGLGRALEKAGAREGDRVRLGKLEWEW